MGKVADSIEQKLRAAFDPAHLDVEDQSESHRGHMGYREGGETHFHVIMTAASFEGQNRVARQRAVYAALAEELAGPVHALSMELKTLEN